MPRALCPHPSGNPDFSSFVKMVDRHPSLPHSLRAYLPYAVAAGLFLLGVLALHRLLAPVGLHEIIRQVRATPWTTLALAALATLAGYLCLAAYDGIALRHIGKPLPTPVVLTGGLMAYAFGNTIGLSAITGGAVRWRVYGGLGLGGHDIAAISAFAAVSFGIAVTLFGLAALALHPSALASMVAVSPSGLRAGALVLLVGLAGALLHASLRRKRLRIRDFELRAPTLPILGSQLLASAGDIGFSALVLYLLLPVTDYPFLTFVGVYAVATMAGVISHVPGGVGVFEAVIMAAMPEGTPTGQLAAALLLYRLIYAVMPFVLALLTLAGLEVWRTFGGRLRPALDSVASAFRPVVPLLLSLMVFGSGIWMSISAVLPARMPEAATEALFPLVFLEASALLSSVLGAALVLLALGVARRGSGAFWMTLAAMIVGAAVAMARGFDLSHAAVLLLAAGIMLPFRGRFDRRTRLTHAALTPGWSMLLLSAVVSFGFVLFLAHKHTPYANELWWQFAVDQRAPRALRAGFLAALLIGLGTLYLLLRAPRLSLGAPDAATLDTVAQVVRSGDDPDGAFALTGDKSILLSDDRRAFVMFGVAGRSWLAYGGPVGPRDAADQVAFAFVDAARQAGARPVFYELGAHDVPLMLELGLTLHKMGEEAVIDLAAFTLEGPQRKGLRGRHNAAARHGLSLDIAAPPHDARLLDALQAISDQWLASKHGHEKGFSVGRFERGWLNRWPLALVRHEGHVVAFANVLATDSRRMATIDLMRHSSAAPSGTMEFLFTALMLALKAQGYRAFSLGMAPLSGLTPERSQRLWDRFGAALYRHGGNFYNFAGLRAFKQKFDPAWQPRYLAAPAALAPLIALADAARLIARPSPPDHETNAPDPVPSADLSDLHLVEPHERNAAHAVAVPRAPGASPRRSGPAAGSCGR